MNEKTRIAILGAAGRMGQFIARIARNSENLEVVARIDIRTDDQLPAIIPSLKDAPQFDVLVDFSSPVASMAALDEMKRRKSAWLIGTTALTEAQKAQILALADAQPVFVSSNTSLGVALMQRLCRQAAAVLGAWDCEILEAHHHGKVDAPSGTALTIANAIADVMRAEGRNPQILTDRSALHEKRNPDSIGIASLRGGTVAGEHTAVWFGQNERLEIKHTAESREIFAVGACKIASWLARQPAGNYDMQQFLDGILH